MKSSTRLTNISSRFLDLGRLKWESDKNTKNKFNFAKVLDNLGYAYFKTNNPKAIALLNTSLKLETV